MAELWQAMPSELRGWSSWSLPAQRGGTGAVSFCCILKSKIFLKQRRFCWNLDQTWKDHPTYTMEKNWDVTPVTPDGRHTDTRRKVEQYSTEAASAKILLVMGFHVNALFSLKGELKVFSNPTRQKCQGKKLFWKSSQQDWSKYAPLRWILNGADLVTLWTMLRSEYMSTDVQSAKVRSHTFVNCQL